MSARASLPVVAVICIGCLLAFSLISGCTQTPTTTTPTTTTAVPTTSVQKTTAPATVTNTSSNTTQMANPASVYCGTVNGTVKIVKNPDGSEKGMCVFQNGTTCDEWDLFRGNCTLAAPKAPVANMSNPAAVNCGKLGGIPKSVKDPSGGEIGYCVFPNGTACEEWGLMKGSCVSANVTAQKPVGMANPASVNCQKIGGTTKILKNPDGSEYGVCAFANGTTCEEWALFNDGVCKNKVATQT